MLTIAFVVGAAHFVEVPFQNGKVGSLKSNAKSDNMVWRRNGVLGPSTRWINGFFNTKGVIVRRGCQYRGYQEEKNGKSQKLHGSLQVLLVLVNLRG